MLHGTINRFKSRLNPSSIPTSVTTTRVSTLPNGIKVASEDSPGHFAAVGVFVNAGSRYEPSEFTGISHLFEKMAFKGTKNKRRNEIMAILENIGGNVQCTSLREHLVYQGSVFKHDIPKTLELLADCVQEPIISFDEVDEAIHTIKYEQEQVYAKPEWLMPELAHRAAFAGNTYGLSTICTPDRYRDMMNIPLLEDYWKLFYRPENYVVAGVGLDHEHLCQWTRDFFQKQAESTSRHSRKDKGVEYTGGSMLYEDEKEDLTRIFMGFKSPEFGAAEMYAASVLQMMLGGGDSFSAGGPGKGMYSKLYTNVLNRYHWVESVTAAIYTYRDCGLFGIHATVPHGGISNILTLIGTELRKIMDKPISKIEMERAKNQLRSSVFMNLESKLAHLEDLGRQVQMRGHRITPREMGTAIENVTQEDLKNVLRKMVSSEPTFVVNGQPKFAPDMTRFCRIFGFGKFSH